MDTDRKTQSNRKAKQLEASIRRLTAAVRRASGGARGGVSGYGWWVLACGDSIGDKPFEDRDQARERLRAEVEAAGIVLPEYIWVWDDEDRALLVITTLPSRDRAERVADRLRGRGLTMRVAKERF
ncbi:MAG: hypothetical protein V3573_05635 [Desulfovibrionaceae bacterium]